MSEEGQVELLAFKGYQCSLSTARSLDAARLAMHLCLGTMAKLCKRRKSVKNYVSVL